MADTRVIPWVVALIATGLVSAALAIWLLWWASDLQQQVTAWYNAQSGSEYDAVTGAFFDRIGSNAYAMESVASPLLAGTVFAILASLVVLARRWEARR
jgi:hypothetical protein